MGAPGAIGTGHVLVLFDGVCNLCNGFVQFIIKRDPEAKFRFASLQSDFGKIQLRQHHLNPNSLHSIVVIVEGKAFERSEAVLRIANHLGGAWKSFLIFKIFPTRFSNAVYNMVAANRYKVFGRMDSCMIPTPELKDRFVE